MKRPTDEDRVVALQRFLLGLARGDDANQLSSAIADLHLRHNTFPGEVFMELAADALDLAGRHASTRSSTGICCRGIFLRSSSEARSTVESSTPCSRRSPFRADSNPICSTR